MEAVGVDNDVDNNVVVVDSTLVGQSCLSLVEAVLRTSTAD